MKERNLCSWRIVRPHNRHIIRLTLLVKSNTVKSEAGWREPIGLTVVRNDGTGPAVVPSPSIPSPSFHCRHPLQVIISRTIVLPTIVPRYPRIGAISNWISTQLHINLVNLHSKIFLRLHYSECRWNDSFILIIALWIVKDFNLFFKQYVGCCDLLTYTID